MTPLTLTFPMPPNLANARMHWRVKHKEKADYWQRLDNLQLQGEIPPPPQVRWHVVSISTVMYLARRMDLDNAMARHKWVLDWLVTRGYIKDDRGAFLQWERFPEQITKGSKPYRIVVTLTHSVPKKYSPLPIP